MTKLYFRHSYIYEETLAKLTGEKFEWKNFEHTKKFAEEFGKYWEQYNDKIFEYYKNLNLTLPEFWIAYPVNKRKGLTPISDPLTFFVEEDFDKAAAVLIHELCHVFLVVGENIRLSNKLWEEISKKYPTENFNTQAHLLVNLLAKGGVTHAFGEDDSKKLLAPERGLEGLSDAWKIIDSKPDALSESNPLDAIKKL
jgi:hypothetical protein